MWQHSQGIQQITYKLFMLCLLQSRVSQYVICCLLQSHYHVLLFTFHQSSLEQTSYHTMSSFTAPSTTKNRTTSHGSYSQQKLSSKILAKRPDVPVFCWNLGVLSFSSFRSHLFSVLFSSGILRVFWISRLVLESFSAVFSAIVDSPSFHLGRNKTVRRHDSLLLFRGD